MKKLLQFFERNNLVSVKNLGWGLVLMTAVFFIMGGVQKVIGTEQMVNNFTFMKLENYRIWIGGLEILGALLLVIPKTSSYGAVLISTIMGGAVALHLSLMEGNGFQAAVILAVCAWVGHCLRKYGLFNL